MISARKDGCYLVNRSEHRHSQNLSYNVSSAGIDRIIPLRYFDLSSLTLVISSGAGPLERGEAFLEFSKRRPSKKNIEPGRKGGKSKA